MQKMISLEMTVTQKKLIKILVNLPSDKKLHLSWQVKYWNMKIRNGQNINDIDTEIDSNQDGFSNTK